MVMDTLQGLQPHRTCGNNGEDPDYNVSPRGNKLKLNYTWYSNPSL